MSGCGLNQENGEMEEALYVNNTLEELNVSNNRFGEVGKFNKRVCVGEMVCVVVSIRLNFLRSCVL